MSSLTNPTTASGVRCEGCRGRWTRPHVKAGGTYSMDDGHIVVDSIERIRLKDVTAELARESGFPTVAALLDIARHGSGKTVFLVRFHYVPPGGSRSSTPGARRLAHNTRESRGQWCTGFRPISRGLESGHRQA